MKLRELILRDLTPEPYDLNKKYEKKIMPIVKKLLAEAEKLNLPIVVLSVAGVRKDDEGPSFSVLTSGYVPRERRTPYTEVVSVIADASNPDILLDTIKRDVLRNDPGIKIASELESLFSHLEDFRRDREAPDENPEVEETPEPDEE